MKIKLLLIMIVCGLVILSGCSKTTESQDGEIVVADSTQGVDDGVSDEVETPAKESPVLSEKETFAQFGAEVACASFDFADAMDNANDDEMGQIGEDFEAQIESLMSKYSYSEDDVEDLKAQYGNDESYADMVVEIVNEDCPHPGEDLQIWYMSRKI